VFTVEQRNALLDRVVRLAREEARVVAAALVGSLALGAGDRFSDVDLTLGIDDDVEIAEVLEDWTATLSELGSVPLVDLQRGPTTYRVFLLPELLQLDLSMTPAAHFRPAGPRFELLFGETAPDDTLSLAPSITASLFIATPAVAVDIFGWGVVYALHARVCIERGRMWQAEHYVGAVRDHALSLACLREGLNPLQARSYDDLSSGALDRLEAAHVSSLETGALRSALAASVTALMHEGVEAPVPVAHAVAESLAELN
jgi:hypothetical protein